MRCTQATLEALGIFGKCPKTGTGVVQVLQQHYKLDWSMIGQKMTVKSFVKNHPQGRYYLSTNGHAMALVDGVLTDTTERGTDNRHLQCVIGVK